MHIVKVEKHLVFSCVAILSLDEIRVALGRSWGATFSFVRSIQQNPAFLIWGLGSTKSGCCLIMVVIGFILFVI